MIKLLWFSRILLMGAVLIAGYLLLHTLNASTLAGCDGSSGCGEILNSRWSAIGSIPVSAFAVGLYLLLLALSIPALANRLSGDGFFRSNLVCVSSGLCAGSLLRLLHDLTYPGRNRGGSPPGLHPDGVKVRAG